MTATRNMTEGQLRELKIRVGIKDAAAALGIGINEAYRQAEAHKSLGGICPVRKLGGQWVVYKPELMRALGYDPGMAPAPEAEAS